MLFFTVISLNLGLCLLSCIISLDVPISIHPLRSDISLGMLSCLLVFLHYYIHKDLDNFSVLILGCYGVTLVFPFLLFQLFFFKDNNTWLEAFNYPYFPYIQKYPPGFFFFFFFVFLVLITLVFLILVFVISAKTVKPYLFLTIVIDLWLYGKSKLKISFPLIL